jgi:putative oxidoreductase
VKSILSRFNDLLTSLATCFQSVFLLFIRLYWGWQYFQTGKGKLGDLDKVTAFFTSLHVPAPRANAVFVSISELIGGVLIMLGLGTRWLTPLLIFEMLIAYLTADREALKSIFSDPDKFTGAAPFVFLYAWLILFAFGAGKISLDYLLWRRTAGPRNQV